MSLGGVRVDGSAGNQDTVFAQNKVVSREQIEVNLRFTTQIVSGEEVFNEEKCVLEIGEGRVETAVSLRFVNGINVEFEDSLLQW